MQRDLDGSQPNDSTNSRLDDGRYSDLADLDDANGNEQLEFDTVASAVNYVRLANAATGNGPTFSAQGGDTNVGMNLSTKGTGVFQLDGKLSMDLSGGAASASGLLMGVGTSVAPATTSVAGGIFAEFRTQSTATSGDSRGLYLRHDINGIAGGGEAVRAFAKVTAAASTVRGAHLSLDLDTAGTVSGFGAAVDAQLMLGGAAYSDDITALNLEIYANASATVTGRTSFLRPVIQGDVTAVADVNANAFFIDLTNVTASSAGMIDTDITALTGYGALKVRCPDGTTRYIPIVTGS